MNDRLDLVTSLSGGPITTTQEREQFRRPELMMLVEDFLFGGRSCKKAERLTFAVKRQGENWMGSDADFTEVEIWANDIPFDLYLYTPHKVKKPAPCFAVVMYEQLTKEMDLEHTLDCDILPIARVVERGYAVAVMPTYPGAPDWVHTQLSESRVSGAAAGPVPADGPVLGNHLRLGLRYQLRNRLPADRSSDRR